MSDILSNTTLMNERKKTIISRDLNINLITHQVKKNNLVLNLPNLSYRTLIVLIESAPKIVSIDQLIDQVWQNIEVSPETVTQRIALLRKSITTKDAANYQYIASIRNQGYRWVPEVKETINRPRYQSFNLNKWVIISFIIFIGYSIWLYFSHGKTNETTAIINRILTENDYTTQAWRYLDKHDFKNNKIAINLFRKSLKSNPNHVNAMTGLSIALSHHVTKFNQPSNLLKEAQLIAHKAININPNSAQAWAALAFTHDANGEIDKAIRFYEKAIELKPNNTSTISSLAYLYSQKGRLLEALKLNISVLGSQQLYLDLQIAQTLELLGFDAIAEQWYKRADELSPDNVFATHNRAKFYLARNQQSKTLTLIYSAINRGVNRPELYVILGIVDLINNKPEQAKNHFNKALKIDTNDIEANLWMFITKQSEEISAEEVNQFKEKWFAKEINWPNQWVYQAILAAHLNKYDEANNHIVKAYEAGYRNYLWLEKLPPFQAILQHSEFLNVLETIQNEVSNQRQKTLKADWLPPSFLDPQIH